MSRLILVVSFISFTLCSCYTSEVPLLNKQDEPDNLPSKFVAVPIDKGGDFKLNASKQPTPIIVEKKDGSYQVVNDKYSQAILMKSQTPNFYFAQTRSNLFKDNWIAYGIVKFNDNRAEIYSWENDNTKISDRDDLIRKLNEKIKSLGEPVEVYRIYSTDKEIQQLASDLKLAGAGNSQSSTDKALEGKGSSKAPSRAENEAKIRQPDTTVSQSGPEKSKKVEVNEVTLCDELAAHPNDPNRMAKGVSLQDLIPLRAYNACKSDTEKYPNTPRFLYQYGRAAEAMNKVEVAGLSYFAASSMGYPMADYNIGVTYSQMGGEENQKNAIEYLQKARKGGVSIATDALSTLIFSPVGFKAGDLLVKLYNNERIDFPKDTVLLYISSFVGPYYRSELVDCRQLVQGSTLMKSVLNGTLGNLGNALSNPLGLANLSRSAEDDALRFNERYGCTSFVTHKMFSAMQKWTAEH